MSRRKIIQAAKYLVVSGLSVLVATVTWEWYFSFFLAAIMLLAIEALDEKLNRKWKDEEKKSLKDKIFDDWQAGNFKRVAWQGHNLSQDKFKEEK